MVKEYTERDVLRLGKRYNNKKRTYLLIDPIQAKHIPAIPSESLSMMTSLGKKVAMKYSEAKLVIGFAETATAIGVAVASCLDGDCMYIHTTREDTGIAANVIEFLEEHSHAAEQKLVFGYAAEYVEHTNEIIIVDDEISTGKTIINIVRKMRDMFPGSREKKIIAASVINRLTPENHARLRAEGIECECLVKLVNIDYTDAVRNIEISAPTEADGDICGLRTEEITLNERLPDPRLGVVISEYISSCKAAAEELLSAVKEDLNRTDDVLVMGTEEFMYPAIAAAREMEERKIVNSVRCHSTTRSPIGINGSEDYPIKNGYKIPSFYESGRDTYIYDLRKYDKVIIITDSRSDITEAKSKISAALANSGNKNIVFVRVMRNA